MRVKRYITDTTLDTLVQWVACHGPRGFCDIEQREFLRGLFFICEECAKQMVEKERRNLFDNLKEASQC